MSAWKPLKQGCIWELGPFLMVVSAAGNGFTWIIMDKAGAEYAKAAEGEPCDSKTDAAVDCEADMDDILRNLYTQLNDGGLQGHEEAP